MNSSCNVKRLYLENKIMAYNIHIELQNYICYFCVKPVFPYISNMAKKMALNLRRRQTILCIVRSSVIMTNKFALSCAHSALNLTNTEFAFICARETTRSCSGTWTCQVHPQLIYDDYGIIWCVCAVFIVRIEHLAGVNAFTATARAQ